MSIKGNVVRCGFGKSFRKITALLLAAIILLLASSCSSCNTSLTSEQDLKVVGSVSGGGDYVADYEVCYDELRYVTMSYKQIMEDNYGKGIWDDPAKAEQYRKELEDAVYSNITANYAVLALCAEVMISADNPTIQEKVNEYVEETKNEASSNAKYAYLSKNEAYKQMLADVYMTDHLYRFLISVDYCENELRYVYTDDIGLIDPSYEAADKYIEENFVRTVHLFISKDRNKNDKDGENTARTLAEALAARISEGDDTLLDLLKKPEYNDDALEDANGYYFTHGEMVKGYEEIAYDLDIGEVSEIFEGADGYYIIQRLELETQYVLLHMQELRSKYIDAEFYKHIDKCKEALVFNLNEYGKTIDLVKLK